MTARRQAGELHRATGKCQQVLKPGDRRHGEQPARGPDPVRNRRQQRPDRSASSGQNRHHRQPLRRLVRRLHPAAGGGRLGGRRPQPDEVPAAGDLDDRRMVSAGIPIWGQYSPVFGGDLPTIIWAELHESRLGQPAGDRLPAARQLGRHRRPDDGGPERCRHGSRSRRRTPLPRPASRPSRAGPRSAAMRRALSALTTPGRLQPGVRRAARSASSCPAGPRRRRRS